MAQQLGSRLYQHSFSQGTLCQAVFAPKNRLVKLNTHSTPHTWLQMTSG
jgi:hypothetical protein